MIELVEWTVMLALAYAGVGVLFALAFVLRGARRIDAAARDGTWGFRVLIFPASAALWPLLLRRWLRAPAEGAQPPAERNPHRDASKGGGAGA